MPKEHRAVMNPKFANWFLRSFVSKSHTVYDPFLGLGTTGSECNKLGINWFGSELIKEYAFMAHTSTGATLRA